MRRLAPRPISLALEGVVDGVEPATLLARVQAVWPAVAGPALSPWAAPTGEREGVLTVTCESAVWAHELELLGPDLLERLKAATDPSGAGELRSLRFRVGSVPN